MFGKQKPPEADASLRARVEALETQIERLEAAAEAQKLDRMQKELELAQVMGRTLRALNAREAKRERAERATENGDLVPGGVGGLDAGNPGARGPVDTSHLAQRFRRF